METGAAVAPLQWSSGLETDSFTPEQLFDSAPTFIAIGTASEFRFKYANRAYERLVQRSDLIGRTVEDALPEVIPQGFLELLREAVDTKSPVSGHDVPLRIDVPGAARPTRRYVDFVFQPLADHNGHICYVICFGYDVTAEHVAKQRAKGLASKLQSHQLQEEIETRTTAVHLVTTLSIRERQVLELLTHGGSSKTIARELSLSPRTIEMYRGKLYQKLGVETSGAAIRVGLQGGLS